MTDEQFSCLQAYFYQHPLVEFALLFGSQANGQAHSESDTDIAIYLKPGYDRDTIDAIWDSVERIAQTAVDLIILNTAPPAIAFAGIQGKQLVVKNDRLFTEYSLEISREAEDFREFVIDWWRWRRKVKGELPF